MSLSLSRSLPLLSPCEPCPAAETAPDSKERATPGQVGEPQRDEQAELGHCVLGSPTRPQEARPAAPGRLGGLAHPVAGASGLASLALADHPAAEAAAATAQAALAKSGSSLCLKGVNSSLAEQLQVVALSCPVQTKPELGKSHSMPALFTALGRACPAFA